jgi:hypothetical protein
MREGLDVGYPAGGQEFQARDQILPFVFGNKPARQAANMSSPACPRKYVQNL